MTWVLVIYYMIGHFSYVQKIDMHTKEKCEALKKEWESTAPHVGNYLNSITSYCIQEVSPKNRIVDDTPCEKLNNGYSIIMQDV